MAALIMVLFYGCEKNITTDSSKDPQIKPKLSSIQKFIFNPSCVGCHSGAAPSGGLNLSEGKAYSNLVNANSRSSNLMRVVPGNSDQSYLMKRLTGANGITTMPPGGKLSQQYINAVGQWIDDGAKNN